MKVNKIVERDGRFYVTGKDGKGNLGKKDGYATKAEADKRLKEIEYFKSHNHRVNVVTTVNQSQIERKGGLITIRDVVPIVDDICMNDIFYPAMEINKSFESIEDTIAPIGHPMDREGNYISAKSGQAVRNYYAGATNENVRKVNNKVLMDVVIKEDQAQTENGLKLLEAINAKNPIHVSTGLFLNTAEQPGLDVNGKEYNYIGSDFEFDHVAILLDEPGAATPDEGVGMFVNSKGDKKQVEFAHLVINSDNVTDELDQGFFVKLKKWLNTNHAPLANEEDMDLKKMKAALKAADMLEDNMDEDAIMNAYDKLMKDKKSDMKGNSEELAAIVANAVQSAVAPLQDKITSLESQLAANQDKELEELTEVIVNSEKGKALGLDADMIKSMGLESVKTMAANCGHAVSLAPATIQNNSSYEFKMEAPE